MKVTTDTKTLADALAVTKRYAGGAAGLVPAQDWVQVRVHDGGASLTVRRWARKTDADVTANIAADGGIPGVVHVDATLLAAAVKTLSGPITLALTETDRGPRLTVTGDGGSAELRAENGADFPAEPAYKFSLSAAVRISECGALASVIASAAKGDDARAVLTGVFFDADGSSAVATDTYRMHVARLAAVTRSVIVPASVLRMALTSKAGGLDVATTDDGKRYRVSFVAQKGTKRSPRTVFVTVTGATIEGPFPNYASLIPSADDYANAWTIGDTSGTADVLRTFANNRNVPAILAAAGSAVRVTASENGTTRDALVPITPDGDAIGNDASIAFNPSYLADAIAHAGDGGTLRLRDAMRAAVVDGGDRLALVMPMRVN